ncbi:MAG TPA: HD domain-containing protein [bacterium]|nr:HD domain-containing protein [bacterium]
MAYDRETYLSAIRSQLEPNIVNHSLALEACMGGLYDYLQEHGQLRANELPREDWLLAGLIHDIDFGGEFKEEHPRKTREALAKYGLEISDAVHQTVLAHARQHSGVPAVTQAQWSIYCADSLTGLIMAVAFVYPSRKLADVKVSSVVKRFLKEPKFAAGTRREEVAECSNPEGLNMPVETFIEICLKAMQGVAADIGL